MTPSKRTANKSNKGGVGSTTSSLEPTVPTGRAMEKTLRTADLQMPRTAEGVISLVKRVMELSAVTEIRITPNGISVTRSMESDDDAVVPEIEGTDTPDFDFMLERIELLQIPFDPGSHPYMCLESATRRLTGEGLKVVAILAPDPETFAAYLGLDEGSTPKTVFGIKVVYPEDPKYPDKLVVVGGPTTYLSDSTHGVILDIGP